MSARRSRLSGPRKQLTALLRCGGNEEVSLSIADTAPRVNCFDQCRRATQPSITLSSTARKEALLTRVILHPIFTKRTHFQRSSLETADTALRVNGLERRCKHCEKTPFRQRGEYMQPTPPR